MLPPTCFFFPSKNSSKAASCMGSAETCAEMPALRKTSAILQQRWNDGSETHPSMRMSLLLDDIRTSERASGTGASGLGHISVGKSSVLTRRSERTRPLLRLFTRVTCGGIKKLYFADLRWGRGRMEQQATGYEYGSDRHIYEATAILVTLQGKWYV